MKDPHFREHSVVRSAQVQASIVLGLAVGYLLYAAVAVGIGASWPVDMDLVKFAAITAPVAGGIVGMCLLVRWIIRRTP
ncbi:hypothetical protein GCM10009422_18140 [Brevundimonas kwangchunensis]|uniref:Uncharacterized protein n=1 Tax=Brevundimonas kwangchunensis TaxID=322163 RepID=A0ABN1GXG7_9CAUL